MDAKEFDDLVDNIAKESKQVRERSLGQSRRRALAEAERDYIEGRSGADQWFAAVREYLGWGHRDD